MLYRRRFLSCAAAAAGSSLLSQKLLSGAAKFSGGVAKFPGNSSLPFFDASLPSFDSSLPVYNVMDYGATGKKVNDARRVLQRAIDACGEAGGGTVYVPPGEYTSGQL